MRWPLAIPPSLSLCFPKMGGWDGRMQNGRKHCVLWWWGVYKWLRVSSFPLWGWVLHHSVQNLADSADIGPLNSFLTACETLWATCCGENAARGTSFMFLMRNRSLETVRVEILLIQHVQQQRKGKEDIDGRSNLQLFHSIYCCFKHFSWTGLVKRLCWWIGLQQWWDWEEVYSFCSAETV